MKPLLNIKEKQENQLDVYNVGNDVETEIGDLVRLLAKIAGKKIKPTFTKKELAGTPRRVPDITKLKKLGFKPKVKLEEGIKLTYNWYAKKLKH